MTHLTLPPSPSPHRAARRRPSPAGALTVLAMAGLCALAVVPPPVAAQAPAAQLVSAGSEIVFTTRQMGVPVEGRFTRFTAQVALDPRQPQQGSVVMRVDTSSARFGSAELDAEVPKAPWLATAQFPQAVFQSTGLKALGGGRFEVSGKLTMKGQTRDLVLPVTLAQSGGTSTATGSFVLKRLDFKIGEGEWTDTTVVANDVTVKFKLALTGLGPL